MILNSLSAGIGAIGSRDLSKIEKYLEIHLETMLTLSTSPLVHSVDESKEESDHSAGGDFMPRRVKSHLGFCCSREGIFY